MPTNLSGSMLTRAAACAPPAQHSQHKKQHLFYKKRHFSVCHNSTSHCKQNKSVHVWILEMWKPPTSYHIMNTKANNDTNGVNNGLLYVIRFFEQGLGQNVYSMGTIHRRKCTHCHLEITLTMRRCFLVTSTMSRHIEKNETRNKNRSFHMKRKKNRSLKREKKIAHLIWAKEVSFQTLPDTSRRGHRSAAPTRANPEHHPHHSPPVRPMASPTHTLSDGILTQTHTATPSDAASARPEQPLGTMRPHAHISIWSPSPQAPAASCTSTPGYHPPAPAQAERAPQQSKDPPAGQAVRPSEAPSGSHPDPSPDPDPEPTHAMVQAEAPRASGPGHELPTGVPHPEGRTPAARPAAAERSGGMRALAGHVGGQPRSTPVPDGQT